MRTVPSLAVVCLALVAAPTPPAAAEVVDASAAGFTSRHEVTVAAAPPEVWDALLAVGEWWNGSHSFSGDPANLRLEARPQGCFCEALPDGGGVRHLTVVAVMPGKLLRMVGGLGPLQGQALSGSMTWEMKPDGDGTALRFTYAVHGYLPQGMEGWSGPVDGVVGDQLQRLARYVETGSPEPAAAEGEGKDGEGGAVE